MRTKRPMLPQIHMEVKSLILAAARLSMAFPRFEKDGENISQKREKDKGTSEEKARDEKKRLRAILKNDDLCG